MWERLWYLFLCIFELPRKTNAVNRLIGDPYGTRTRVFAVKGRRPRPLDEGAVLAGGGELA